MKNNQIGMVFPGQGSQHIGMLQELSAITPVVRDTFTEASDQLGYDLWQITQENLEGKLDQTEYTQPAILTASIAMWRVLQQQVHWTPTVLAGHSLGEYTALVCANALRFTDAVKLVALRGRLMQSAVATGAGAMAAIVGLDDIQVNDLCAQCAENEIVSCANYNSPGQVVIAGQHAAVLRVVAQAKAAGAKLAKVLPVSVPSHCALMDSAAEAFAAALYAVNLQIPTLPVVHNVDANVKQEVNQIRLALIHQLRQPVLWVDVIRAMHNQGVRCFVECGPGKVLSGLIKRIYPEELTVALASYTNYLQIAIQ